MGKRDLYDIIVVGAGASGLMAAITGARRGKRVLVVEHKDKIGKKILATGNGKCNFTNANMDISCFYGDRRLLEGTLRQFSKEDCLSFFRELGIYPKNKNGYFYPNSEQAASVVTALELELERLPVNVLLSAEIRGIQEGKKGFTLEIGQDTYVGKALILATGLLANPKLGSDGSIFPFIKEMGHGFSPIVPALCGFYAKGINFKKVAGVRAEAEVSLYIEDHLIKKDWGELQLVDYGISGIPVFQISHHASLGLKKGKLCEVAMNFLPALSKEEVYEEIKGRCDSPRDWKVEDIFNGLLNQKLATVILEESKIKMGKVARELKEEEIRKLCEKVTNLRVSLTKPRDYEFAQVCAGGIRTEEINCDTLESNYVPGLYFAGELLDVDGICGGYNLQWAWASGYVAGGSASR